MKKFTKRLIVTPVLNITYHVPLFTQPP